MKWLVVVHEATFDERSAIGVGRNRINHLSERLEPLLYQGGGKLRLLCLSSLEVKPMTEFLSQVLESPVTYSDSLLVNETHPVDLEAAYQLVKTVGQNADSVIVMVPKEYSTPLVTYFGHREFGLSWEFPQLHPCEGFYLDLVDKTCERQY